MHVIPAREPEARRLGLAGGLITGSTDGKLQLWNSQLELGRCLDCVPLLGPQNPLVHSCTWDEPNHKLLVAFWSAEVSATCANYTGYARACSGVDKGYDSCRYVGHNYI